MGQYQWNDLTPSQRSAILAAVLAVVGDSPVTGVLPIANPAGGTVVTAESPFFSEGEIQVVEMAAPAEGGSAPTVLAFKVAGDPFPRLILNSDLHSAGLCIGDGQSDPSDQVQITTNGAGGIEIWAASAIQFDTDSLQFSPITVGSIFFNGMVVQDDLAFEVSKGPVLVGPDGTSKYRLVVANDGTLSTQAV